VTTKRAPCLVCGVPTEGSRCGAHRLEPTAARDPRTNRAWRRKAAAYKRGRTCTYCGTPGEAGNPLTLDHVVPLALGGAHDLSNAVVACRRCNSSRGARVRRVG
jgi:5-methylcytosine-specific restriction endonuclease McrA